VQGWKTHFQAEGSVFRGYDFGIDKESIGAHISRYTLSFRTRSSSLPGKEDVNAQGVTQCRSKFHIGGGAVAPSLWARFAWLISRQNALPMIPWQESKSSLSDTYPGLVEGLGVDSVWKRGDGPRDFLL
jgi:hypothetical protein